VFKLNAGDAFLPGPRLNASFVNLGAAHAEAQNLQALVPHVQLQIDAARAQGAGSVIVISHLQNAANERNVLIPGLKGVDVVLSGGGHELMADTFNVLPFTNLVKTAPSVNAEQLKTIMEHSVARSSPSGAAEGRFAQVSGMRAVYDTTRASGDRVVSIVLDDGTVLVRGGAVVSDARNFSLTTIDFTVNGGNGYPFAAAGIEFENAVASITYQQALQEFIADPTSEGGLGGVITAARHAAADLLDPAGWSIWPFRRCPRLTPGPC